LGWSMTLPLIAAGVVLYAFAEWRRRLPFNPNKVRLMPWMPIQALLAGCLLMLVVHAFNLAGLHTGKQ